MKKLLYILTISLISGVYSTQIFSQTATYNEVINKKKKGSIQTYIAKNGQSYSINDTLELGVPLNNENYDYIQQNAGVAMYPLTAVASGSLIAIKKIKIYAKTLIVKTSTPHGYVYNLYISNFEGALENGEVKDPDYISPEEALRLLKLEKDKLDLELITQEEYNKKKEELSKLIK